MSKTVPSGTSSGPASSRRWGGRVWSRAADRSNTAGAGARYSEANPPTGSRPVHRNLRSGSTGSDLLSVPRTASPSGFAGVPGQAGSRCTGASPQQRRGVGQPASPQVTSLPRDALWSPAIGLCTRTSRTAHGTLSSIFGTRSGPALFARAADLQRSDPRCPVPPSRESDA